MSNLVGTEIEDYVIEELLDDGGTGIVYRAKKPRSGKSVTIKIVAADKVGDQHVLERYMREMRLMEEVSHPNIKRIINWGITADERPYIISDYIEGSTLSAQLKKTPFSPLTAWYILKPLTDVLQYLHEQDIIHRNLKPRKILLEDGTGKIYLNDFGTSKQVGVDQTLFSSLASLAPVSSPEYMAPEMVHSKAIIDGRADLYSLAVVTYEMLLGRLPFLLSKSYIQVALDHTKTPPPPPRSLNPEFPEGLEAVILKGLAKKPDDRYPTAFEYAEAYYAALTALSETEQNAIYWV